MERKKNYYTHKHISHETHGEIIPQWWHITQTQSALDLDLDNSRQEPEAITATKQQKQHINRYLRTMGTYIQGFIQTPQGGYNPPVFMRHPPTI